MAGSAKPADVRFAFGKNWKRYLKGVGDKELDGAKRSLAVVVDKLAPARSSFLDIGSGSGLFSRAAYELGFARVVSFDCDQDSVEATQAMKQSCAATDSVWQVTRGSVLDTGFMRGLGQHDVVYSWGVLHHTGAIWEALDQAAAAVRPGGMLFIALYNDQGWISRYWYLVKRLYVSSPGFVRLLLLLGFWTYFGVGLFLADLFRLRNPLRRHTGDARGMKFFTDVIDWVGGFPFQVASPDAVAGHLRQRGFRPIWQSLVGRRHGCNEFVFCRERGK